MKVRGESGISGSAERKETACQACPYCPSVLSLSLSRGDSFSPFLSPFPTFPSPLSRRQKRSHCDAIAMTVDPLR